MSKVHSRKFAGYVVLKYKGASKKDLMSLGFEGLKILSQQDVLAKRAINIIVENHFCGS